MPWILHLEMRNKTETYKARIKKLEAIVRKGQKYCPQCRIMVRHSLLDPHKLKPQPEEIIKARCELCRSEYTVSLKNIAQGEREIHRLKYSFTLEDLYTNKRAHALGLWWKTRYGTGERQIHALEEKARKDPLARRHLELIEERQKQYMRKHKRLRAKYGEFPFPEHGQLIESIRMRGSRNRGGEYVSAVSKLEDEETAHLICAELERIICGETRPETIAAIEDVRRRISEAIEAAARDKERREDEGRRKSEEFWRRMRGGKAGVVNPETGQVYRAAPEEPKEPKDSAVKEPEYPELGSFVLTLPSKST